MSSYSGTWADKTGSSGRSASLSGVTLANQTSGANGATCSFPYLTGTPSSSIVFTMPAPGSAYSLCTVSVYPTGGTTQRIFQSTAANWLQGHWHGSAGVAYFGVWNIGSDTPSALVLPLNNWVFMCTAIANSTSLTILDNGYANYTTSQASTVTPWSNGGTISINSVVTGSGEYSTFGVAELIVWNYTLPAAQLYQESSALASKYCLTGAPAPPPPSPPLPPPGPPPSPPPPSPPPPPPPPPA